MTSNQFQKKLPILIGCRVRLNEFQRDTLKSAWHNARQEIEPEQPPRIGGSTVTTHTSHNIARQLGMSDLVISDLISTRESVSLTTVINIQKALNVEVITTKDVMEACESYCNYVFNHQENV